MLDDTEIAVQDLGGGEQVYPYPIPEEVYSSGSTTETWKLSTVIVKEQEKACLCIWRHAKNALTKYKSIRSGLIALQKLTFRYTDGEGANSEYGGDIISLKGTPANKDWFDYDVIAHEMGHWIMDRGNGQPTGQTVEHSFNQRSNLPTAYREGWANYFSSVIRESFEYRDYTGNENRFSGYDLVDATQYAENGVLYYVNGESNSAYLFFAEYADNLLYERNVTIALWNLTEKGIEDYLFAEKIMIQNGGAEGFKEYYEKYMAALEAGKRIAAWEIFDKCKCAYDMELPVITSLELRGTNLVLHATDNVGIARVEWYVDDKSKHTSLPNGDPLSGDILVDIGTLGLTSRQSAVIKCEVYDFEGVQTRNRPRSDKCSEIIKDITIP